MIWKIYTDFDNFVVEADCIGDACVVAEQAFDLRMEAEEVKESKDSKRRYDEFVERGSDIPEWVKRDAKGEGSNYFENYEIYKIKKIGMVDDGEFGAGTADDDE